MPGLFSTIGRVLGGAAAGPIGGILGDRAGDWLDEQEWDFGEIGSSIGGLIDADRMSHKQNTRRRNYFTHLSEDARRGGFHPLEALRSTGGAGYGPLAGPRVASSTLRTQSFDQLENVISGDHRAEQNRRELVDAIMRTDLDRARAGLVPASGERSRGRKLLTSLKLGDAENRPATKTDTTDTGGDGFLPNPKANDAQAWSEHFGEPGEWAKSALNFGLAIPYNVRLHYFGRVFGQKAALEVAQTLRDNPDLDIPKVFRTVAAKYSKRSKKSAFDAARTSPRASTIEQRNSK